MEVTSGTTSVTPGLNGSVIPVKLAAKARWADLKSKVNKTVDTKGKVKNIKVKYRVSDVWQQIMDNEELSDVAGKSAAGHGSAAGMKLTISMYDTNFPPTVSDNVTKWTRPPEKIFSQNVGDGVQDFRWLSMIATKRYTAGYKPNGRLRQRELAVGSRANMMPQKIYLEKVGESMGFDKKSTKVITESTKLKAALRDGDTVYVHFRKGVPLGLFAGREDSKIQVPLFMNCTASDRDLKAKQKAKKYHAFLKTKRDKVRKLQPFKVHSIYTRKEEKAGPELVQEPGPAQPAQKDKKVVEKPLDLPTSVFSERAELADSRGFYDTDDFYERVCEADFHYCPRIRRMVEEDPGDYEKIKDIVAENYRYIREAFRYHVAESASDSFEMSWMDFTAFAKFSKIVDPHEEESGGFSFNDLDSIWILVNCHEHNDAVKSHHIRYLSRFEFLEALVRIAVSKYGLNDAGHPRKVSSAVETLLEANIKQIYKRMDANVFRRTRLYLNSTNKVFGEHEKSLRLLFRTYAKFQSRKDKYTRKHTIKNGGIAFADDPNCLTKVQFIELLQAAGVFGDKRRLKKDACRVFIYAQNTTLDEFQRSKEAALRDDSKTLCYPEFLEAIARLAEVDHVAAKMRERTEELPGNDFTLQLSNFLSSVTSKMNL